MLKISFFWEIILIFSTESAEKPQIDDLQFLIAIYSPKNDNKHSSEIRHCHQGSPFTISEVFSSL